MKSIPRYSKNNYTYLANYHTLLIFLLTSEFSIIIVIQLEVLQTCGLIGSPTAYEPSLFEKQYVPEGRYGLPYPRSVANYAVLVANASRGIRVWGQCRLYWGVSWLQGSSQFCRCLISQHTSPTTVFCSLTVSTG
jgi:hypothetical protein